MWVYSFSLRRQIVLLAVFSVMSNAAYAEWSSGFDFSTYYTDDVIKLLNNLCSKCIDQI
jgi:hypothetical protein